MKLNLFKLILGESDEKYSKRKVESNWSRYDETDENINDNLNGKLFIGSLCVIFYF